MRILLFALLLGVVGLVIAGQKKRKEAIKELIQQGGVLEGTQNAQPGSKKAVKGSKSGGHQRVKMPDGNRVAIPNSSDIKKGTANSIQNSATGQDSKGQKKKGGKSA